MSELVVSHVEHFFGSGKSRVHVLHDVSFSADAGEVNLILGPSGSGKSTLLTIAGGLLTPTSGSVQVAGVELAQASTKAREQLRLASIGFVLQAYHLLPFLKVKEQFELVTKVKKTGNLNADALSKLLTTLGLTDFVDAYPGSLSGGQQQRVAIARALYPDPEVILADEPTAALDSQRVQQVGELLANLAHTRNKAIVIVTHDERLRAMADHVYEMIDGKLTATK
ncbi:ABC transporter ATP-binding protein [Lacticaseibacillus sp. GG6-2]